MIGSQKKKKIAILTWETIVFLIALAGLITGIIGIFYPNYKQNDELELICKGSYGSLVELTSLGNFSCIPYNSTFINTNITTEVDYCFYKRQQSSSYNGQIFIAPVKGVYYFNLIMSIEANTTANNTNNPMFSQVSILTNLGSNIPNQYSIGVIQELPVAHGYFSLSGTYLLNQGEVVYPQLTIIFEHPSQAVYIVCYYSVQFDIELLSTNIPNLTSQSMQNQNKKEQQPISKSRKKQR